MYIFQSICIDLKNNLKLILYEQYFYSLYKYINITIYKNMIMQNDLV